MLSCVEIKEKLNKPGLKDAIGIIPYPETNELENETSASIDLRLGCWFLTFTHKNVGSIKLHKKKGEVEKIGSLVQEHYLQFGEEFFLHPGAFVLASTLEWIKLPLNLGGYVTSKSSTGRHGLVIATATGVHPGFAGCLTLEISNVGEVPLALQPGSLVCQLFFHRVSELKGADTSSFNCTRKPMLKTIFLDKIALALSDKKHDS